MNNRIKDYIDEFNYALDLEIRTLKEIGGTKYRIYDGNFIAKVETDHVYLFNLEVELQLPSGTPVRLEIDNKHHFGEIITCDNFEATIALKNSLDFYVSHGNMYCEPWQLLIALQTRLNEITEPNTTRNRNLAMATLLESRLKAEGSFEKLNRGAKTALEMAANNPVTFIWGPPGTGKTQTLAMIALKSMVAKKRVLVISHSNIAVDGAVERIYELGQKKLRNFRPGLVLRYGYSKKAEVRDHPELTSFNLVLESNHELKQKKETLDHQIKELKNSPNLGAKLISAEREFNALRQEIKEKEHALVKQARIVATSISKATMDAVIYDGYFDMVLVDEASMAYIPQAIFAASIAKKQVVYIGDFRQLSPIALSEQPAAQKWLLQDIFEYSKVKAGVDNKKYHPWMVLLATQRRMHPKISGFVSTNIYGGLLRDHQQMAESREYTKALPPFPEEVLAFVNLSLFPAFCAKDTSGSRYNILSALVAVNLALQASLADKSTSASIITPYATQSRIVKAMLVDIVKLQKQKLPITAATVHQFQGSESDVVILDCVDSYRQTRPSVLLTGTVHDRALRLINVAVTRAKGKFITIAHRGFWESKLSHESILSKMLNYLKEKGEFVVGDELYSFMKNKAYLHGPSLYGKKDFLTKLSEDISKAKSSIYMEVPQGKILESSAFDEMIREANQRGVQVVIRAENPNNLPANLQNLAQKYSFAWSPLTIIDKKVIWFGYPWIELERVEYNPFIRFVGEKTSQTLISILGLEAKSRRSPAMQARKIFANSLGKYIEEHLNCPKCGRPMQLRKSQKGKAFLGCSAFPTCRETMLVPQDIVNSYLRITKPTCPDCGSPYEAKISKYGIYIGCMGYQCRNILQLWDI